MKLHELKKSPVNIMITKTVAVVLLVLKVWESKAI